MINEGEVWRDVWNLDYVQVLDVNSGRVKAFHLENQLGECEGWIDSWNKETFLCCFKKEKYI